MGIAIATYGLLKLASGVTKNYHPFFVVLIKGGLIVFLLLVVASIFLLGINLLTEIEVPFNDKIRKITIYFFFPLTILLGKILRIPKEQIQKSFLEANNKLILANTYHLPPQKILLLLPHCLQNSSCSIKLTLQGSNCQRCGRCNINDLWEIVDKYKIHLAIATGGEAARKFITDLKPEAVVAVACTKEMIMGIQDTYPLLVLSIINQQPNGPCIDTMVDLGRVKEAIKFFLGDKGAKYSFNTSISQ
jgi:hypothetical protein